MPTDMSSFMLLSFLLSSFILIILLLFQLHISFQQSITTDGQDGAAMATPGGTRGDRQARQVRLLLLLFFFLLSSFLLLAFTIFFVANCSNRRGEAKWDGTTRDNTGGDSNADGTGGRRAGGGGRRR